ncbi:MAG: hypothetical protein JWN95_1262 [Frankiales bacterium]|nr:hypothetical protein [Frankiales bacterium]
MSSTLPFGGRAAALAQVTGCVAASMLLLTGCLSNDDATAVHGPYASGPSDTDSTYRVLQPSTEPETGSESAASPPTTAACFPAESSAAEGPVGHAARAFGAFRTYIERSVTQNLLDAGARASGPSMTARRASTFIQSELRTAATGIPDSSAACTSLRTLFASASNNAKTIATSLAAGQTPDIAGFRSHIQQIEAAMSDSGHPIVEATSVSLDMSG